MNKQNARYGLWFYLVTMILSFIFPKQIFGNIFIIITYLIVSLILIYFIYFYKRKKQMTDKNL